MKCPGTDVSEIIRGWPGGSSGEEIALPCDVADSGVVTLVESCSECAIGGNIPIGTDFRRHDVS